MGTKIVDIIEAVVNTVRDLDVLTIVLDAGTTYAVIADKRVSLWVDAPVVLTHAGGTIYGTVSEVTDSKNFKILLEANFTIGDFQLLELNVQFIHGHLLDILNVLAQWTENPDYKEHKFPLVILPQDIPQPGAAGFDSAPRINVIICTDTQQHFNAAERYTYSFNTVLYNLGERFLEMLERSPSVYFRKSQKQWIDRLFWGREAVGGNGANKLNDFIDAIELKDIEIKILNTC